MNPLRLASLALLGVVISCSDSVAPHPQPLPTDIQVAHQRWRAQNLHTYAFILQRSCFCGNINPLFVAVVNDSVAGVLDFTTTKTLDRNSGQTIEQLFTFVQKAIDKPAQRIIVEYDPTKGFPSVIDYDGAAQIADDEIVYHISDVHPITPQQRMD